jgi:nitrate/nitrite transport system substrate-binding protein
METSPSSADHVHGPSCGCAPPPAAASIDHYVEESLLRAICGGNLAARRRFLKWAGAGTVTSILSSVFPLDAAKAAVQEGGKLERTKLSIGFIPITCATPIIMAEPMGFYKKFGLDVTVRRASGWAVIRDWAVNKEVDAAHMLSPMPLALTLGSGAKATPFYTAAIENVNGQAITLHRKHRGVKNARDMKGFKFCVPFPYSMHNYLLRYFLADGGLNPDRDCEIRIVPPPEMVANLRAENIDGYLAPDPFNQRAVYDGIGFIYKLSKELWDGHPCCAFAVSEEFVRTNPNTYLALLKAIVSATNYAQQPANRSAIAKAIAPANYLNQPAVVLEQVLNGRYADGLGAVRNEPGRIGFDPFPYHSMAVWILTQMKRWGQIQGDIDYRRVAERVFRAADCNRALKELGLPTRDATYAKHTIMERVFDSERAEEYLRSFGS